MREHLASIEAGLLSEVSQTDGTDGVVRGNAT
jgi:hypothetical protein